MKALRHPDLSEPEYVGVRLQKQQKKIYGSEIEQEHIEEEPVVYEDQR